MTWWAPSADVMHLRSAQRLSKPLRWDGNLLCFDMSDINMVHYALALHFMQIHRGIRAESCFECVIETWQCWPKGLRNLFVSRESNSFENLFFVAEMKLVFLRSKFLRDICAYLYEKKCQLFFGHERNFTDYGNSRRLRFVHYTTWNRYCNSILTFIKIIYKK